MTIERRPKIFRCGGGFELVMFGADCLAPDSSEFMICCIQAVGRTGIFVRHEPITPDQSGGFMTRLKALPIDAAEQVPADLLGND